MPVYIEFVHGGELVFEHTDPDAEMCQSFLIHLKCGRDISTEDVKSCKSEVSCILSDAVVV